MTNEEAEEGIVTTAVVSRGNGAGLLPVLRDSTDVDAFVNQALLEWNAYQQLTLKLLDETDYQKIGNRQFKKKSAWRKYAKAFDISCETRSEEIARDPDGYPRYVRVVVRAIAPDGRYQDADQECHVTERCCEQPCHKRSWSNHYCCTKGCDGRKHFSHPGDLPATAFTRAKNRAIADLIGAGEVSAEEMKDDEVSIPKPPSARRTTPQRGAAPSTAVRDENADDVFKLRHDLNNALAKAHQGDLEAMNAWKAENMPEGIANADADRCAELIAILETGA